MQKQVVGWREYVSLPDWGIGRLRAKIDTGARTSAIHVQNLQELPNGFVRFEVVLDRKRKHKHVVVECPVNRFSHVTSSNGESLARYFVHTTFRLGPVEKIIEVSLVNRDNMKVRMLVGRSALEPEFLVDSSVAYNLGKDAP